MSRIDELHRQFESGFLGFWVRKYRISYLLTIALIILGLLAAYNIPKESSPSVKLGMIAVSTVYPGTNPEDIDSLISNKIYREIKDIKGIEKIQTSSSLGVSSVAITLKSSANSKDVLDNVRNNINRIQFPTDAKTPVITEVETNTNQIFSVFVYSKDNSASRALLTERAVELQKKIEGLPGVEKVSLSAQSAQNASVAVGGGGNDTAYDVDIIIPEDKLNALGLSIGTIASMIRSYNIDQPIGNFSIGDKNYDYRIEGKNSKSFEFLDMPITLSSGTSVRLGDIARIERNYKNDDIKTVMIGTGGLAHPYVALTVNKSDSASIFAASDVAKKGIAKVF